MSKDIYCHSCHEKITSKYAKKFCNSSCSAKYNNTTLIKKNAVIEVNCKNCASKIKSRTYCNLTCQKEYEWKQRKILILEGKGNSGGVKRYLLEINGHKCNKCELKIWNDQLIPLELEHIDGNSENNSINNVELLCPNCHAQTPTYKGKNVGNGRHSRRLRYQEGKSY